MDNTITQTTAHQPRTEQIMLLVDIMPEDEDKLTSISQGSALPKGTAFANMVYFQTKKFIEYEQSGKPLPACITPPIKKNT